MPQRSFVRITKYREYYDRDIEGMINRALIYGGELVHVDTSPHQMMVVVQYNEEEYNALLKWKRESSPQWKAASFRG